MKSKEKIKLIEYLEAFIEFKDDKSKVNVSSILNAISKRSTGVHSAFSDIKINDALISVKFVEKKKNWNNNLIDNFTGDTAWLITNTVLKNHKINGSKSDFIENEYEKDQQLKKL